MLYPPRSGHAFPIGIDTINRVPERASLVRHSRTTLDGYTADIPPYIDLINTAFLDHPTPLRVTLEQIEHMHGEPNRPGRHGILRTAKDGDRLLHDQIGRDPYPTECGHINLVGVLPGRRRGLGRWL